MRVRDFRWLIAVSLCERQLIDLNPTRIKRNGHFGVMERQASDKAMEAVLNGCRLAKSLYQFITFLRPKSGQQKTR